MISNRLKLHGAAALLLLACCSGEVGDRGPPGERGAAGSSGTVGPMGEIGPAGAQGVAGEAGQPGPSGERGPVLDLSRDPLSSVVALALDDRSSAVDLPSHVRDLVERRARGTLGRVQFPLGAAATDSLRTIEGLTPSVVVKWLDPLTFDGGLDAPRFGANNDFIAYFGEGWEIAGTPYFAGSSAEGWLWVNHEYVSGALPEETSAPSGQHQVFAKFLALQGGLTTDPAADIWSLPAIDDYLRRYKQQLGGSWLRIVQDPGTREWSVDRGAANLRYDATSNTLARVVGRNLARPATDDLGVVLEANVVPGIMGDCSGAKTPWGTVISAEENVQDFFGDLETAWDGNNKFVVGSGFDPGVPISVTVEPSASSAFGRSTIASERHDRDAYGYLVEIDPGAPAAEWYGSAEPGAGHRKLGGAGRARWENATFAVDEARRLIDGQPIVMYAGDDRRGGRIYKIVSRAPYAASMTKSETRALLDDVLVYVAHLSGLDDATGNTMVDSGAPPTDASPGRGRWIELSLDSRDEAPNAPALGPGTTVGDALRDPSWNGVGAFLDNDDLLAALFTVSNKIGVMELNRPEDLEFAPGAEPTLYVAFTNHTRRVALDQDGIRFDPATHDMDSPERADRTGSIFALREVGSDPGSSAEFDFFAVWFGTEGRGEFDAANPDNLLIDREGGVWFGTDGNFGLNQHADALYYLDLDPNHRAGAPGVVEATYGRAFRIAAAPSDAEATGPEFNADLTTLFFSVQHPGEEKDSTWPKR